MTAYIQLDYSKGTSLGIAALSDSSAHHDSSLPELGRFPSLPVVLMDNYMQFMMARRQCLLHASSTRGEYIVGNVLGGSLLCSPQYSNLNVTTTKRLSCKLAVNYNSSHEFAE